ncbi:unnamed protein product [Arabis nemorensis]|uniref:NYN domain-containing protein n=1 Tax=Arabis nemorensis TaxID=586526 RepID=A0A565CUX1_9BRAS|nr:unnamed protein product [Arabis nemorensis]
MAKFGCPLEAYIFNPPISSIPLEQLDESDNLKTAIRFARDVVKASIATDLGYDEVEEEDPFVQLASWMPNLYVNQSDPICSEYIGYFMHRIRMSELGADMIERIASRYSLKGLLFGGGGSSSSYSSPQPLHYLPSASMVVNTAGMRDFTAAHGIHQWWDPRFISDKNENPLYLLNKCKRLEIYTFEALIDLENGGIPRHYSPSDVLMNMREYMYQRGFLVHSIVIYACETTFPKRYLDSFDLIDGVNVVRVKKTLGETRDDADYAMKAEMNNWGLERLPPAPMFIVTSDKDYVKTIQILKNRGFQFLVAYLDHSVGAEIRCVADFVDWRKVALGHLLIIDASNMPKDQSKSPPKRLLPPSPPPHSSLVKVVWDVQSTLDIDDKRSKVMPDDLSLEDMRDNIENELHMLEYKGIDGDIQIITEAQSMSTDQLIQKTSY